MNLPIRPFSPDDLEDVVQVSLAAWTPVYHSFDERPLVTLWKTMTWYEQARSTEGHTMEVTLPNKWIAVKGQKLHRPVQIAVERYEQEIEDALANAISRLTEKK